MKKLPDDFEYIGDVMSNFDHCIEDGVEEKLKSGKFYGDYPAWNFHGKVWFDGENFLCEVKQYRSHIDTTSAKTLRELMETTSDLYGWS